jgi:hypothetical protein
MFDGQQRQSSVCAEAQHFGVYGQQSDRTYRGEVAGISDPITTKRMLGSFAKSKRLA